MARACRGQFGGESSQVPACFLRLQEKEVLQVRAASVHPLPLLDQGIEPELLIGDFKGL